MRTLASHASSIEKSEQRLNVLATASDAMDPQVARYFEQLLVAHGAEDLFVDDAEDEVAIDDEVC